MTPAPTLDLERLVADVRTIALGDPDHVYQPPVKLTVSSGSGVSCFYDRDASGTGPHCGCLIGQGIARQVPFNGAWELFEGGIGTLIYDENAFTVEWNTDPLGSADDERVDWLTNVQDWQDTKHTWGSSIEHADRVADGTEEPIDDTEEDV